MAHSPGADQQRDWNNNVTTTDGFVFDTEFLVQAVYFGFRIGSVPVPVRYFSEASSIDFSNSVVYGLKTLGALVKFINQNTGIKKYPLFDIAQR